MLDLSDDRWATLRSHFEKHVHDAEDRTDDLRNVPELLRRWHAAVGTYAEEYAYDDVCEAYLHQRTILNVAYAVVPHLASRLGEVDPDRRLEILDDMSTVEAVRLRPPAEVERVLASMQTLPEELREQFMQSTRNRHPPLPDDLAPAYFEAIRSAQIAAAGLVSSIRDGECFRLLLSCLCRLHGRSSLGAVIDDLDHDPERLASDLQAWVVQREKSARPWRRHVAALRSASWQDEDITFGVTALVNAELVHEDWAQGLAALRGLEPRLTPQGWFERTRLLEASGELMFRALRSIAWCAGQTDLERMLRAEAGR